MLICPNVGQTVIKKSAAISNVEFVQTDRSYSYIVLALGHDTKLRKIAKTGISDKIGLDSKAHQKCR